MRLPATFFEDFLRSFEERRLDVACVLYMPPPHSTLAIKVIHIVLNGIFVAVQKFLSPVSMLTMRLSPSPLRPARRSPCLCCTYAHQHVILAGRPSPLVHTA